MSNFVSILIILISASSLAAALDDCQGFPFFDRPEWHRLPQDCNLTTADVDDKHYDFCLGLPDTLEDYFPEKARRCLSQLEERSGEPLEFGIRANITWGSTFWFHGTFACSYGSIKDISERTEKQCDYPFRTFPVMGCGEHNIQFFGKQQDSQKYANSLGNITLDLPLYTRLYQTKEDITSATLSFDPVIRVQQCLRRSYTVRCGRFIKRGLLESEDLVIQNLFPGSNYSCTYENEDLNGAKVIQFSTAYLNLSIAPFHVTDESVSLDPDMFKDILDNHNLAVMISIKKLNTNKTHTVQGDDAVNTGVNDLKANTHYKACVQLKQLRSYYDNKNQTWCFRVKTLPPSSTSTEVLVAAVVILSLVILCFVVAYLSKKDSSRSVSGFASNVKARLLKRSGEEET